MIQLYTWSTPNGRKISIMLEELGLPYQIHAVNLQNKEQFAPEFLKISPNNKIPAIVDDEVGLSIFESGAILTYLAEKTGRFLAKTGAQRYKTLEWLNWQVGGLGPMLGQLGFYANRAPEKIPFVIQRFAEEAERLLSVMDRQLSQFQYLSGHEYTIADISCYAWTLAATTGLKEALKESLAKKTNIDRWLKEVGARPAVIKGMEVPKI